jgi:CBS domain containing-hemolysin-like protein
MYFDLFDKGMTNWKGQSGNTLVITLVTMFLPVVIVLMLRAVFGETVAYWFMLIVGIGFAATSRYWLKWIYRRFHKRRYVNMEGFRSNC